MAEERGFELRMNTVMHPVYDDLQTRSPSPLPPVIAEDVAEGVVLIDGCLFVRANLGNLARAKDRDGKQRERWVNKIPLGSPFHQVEPAWRPQLLGWGLEIAHRLLTQAAELCGDARVQTYLWLQPDDAGATGPTEAITLLASPDETPYATGAIDLYRVREPSDDPWNLPEHDPRHPELINQPLMTLSHGHVIQQSWRSQLDS